MATVMNSTFCGSQLTIPENQHSSAPNTHLLVMPVTNVGIPLMTPTMRSATARFWESTKLTLPMSIALYFRDAIRTTEFPMKQATRTKKWWTVLK